MKKTIISLAIILCLSLIAVGEEGMWTLNQIKNLELEKKGFKISALDIYNPNGTSITDAIVLLGGGTWLAVISLAHVLGWSVSKAAVAREHRWADGLHRR